MLKNFKFLRIFAAVLLTISCISQANAETRYVSTTGTDVGDCTNPLTPCATIAYALEQALIGDTIAVQQGTYTESLSVTTSVTIQGGYDISFELPLSIDPTLTVINGGGSSRTMTILGPDIDVTLDGLRITNGNATGFAIPNNDFVNWGGGVLALQANLIANNLQIDNNIAFRTPGVSPFQDGNGGGIATLQTSMTLTNSVISSNTCNQFGSGAAATGTGGGISFFGNQNLSLMMDNCDIFNNIAMSSPNTSAEGHGGGLWININGPINAQITNNRFYNNHARAVGAMPGSGMGGGIYLSNFDTVNVLQFSGNEIHDNTAVSTTGTLFGSLAAGGGIYLERSAGEEQVTIQLENNQILNNIANSGAGLIRASGGGIYSAGINLHSTNDTLSDNIAGSNGTTVGRGGAVYSTRGELLLMSATLKNNTALLDEATSTIATGGAVHFESDNTSTKTMLLLNSVLFDNQSAATTAGITAGDGVYYDNIQIVGSNIQHNTFTNTSPKNSAGIYIADGTVSLNNNIITDFNVGIDQVLGLVSESNNLFFQNTDNTSGTVSMNGGSFDTDPLFASAADCDFHLLPGSPAIDAGIDLSVTSDFENEPRPILDAPDIGADEFSNIDFGDAPAPYPTLFADGGAAHNITPGFFMGAAVDPEFDGQVSPTAQGDDLNGIDDEDGISTLPSFITNELTTLDISTSGSGFINVFIDYNNDGDWSDPGEQAVSGFGPTVTGINPVSFTIPNDAIRTLSTGMRVRFSTTSTLTANGLAPDGEVEDYLIPILGRADLAVTKTASLDPVFDEENLTYTITATNNGPADALNVSVLDDFPASTTFVSAVTSSGTFDSGTKTWTIGNLPVGAPATLTLTVNVNSGTSGIITNTAIISGFDLDEVTGNNTAVIQTTAILQPPIITQQPDSQTVDPGSTIQLTLGAVGSKPLTYQWFKNGAPITIDTRISGITSSSLSITFATESDEGNYTCEVTNAAGNAVSDIATITVNDNVPARITMQPLPQSVIAGNASNFSVFAVGNAPIAYQWKLNGANLSNDVRISGVNTASLTITNVTDLDEGDYSCEVTNAFGNDTSDAASLIVNNPPSIDTQPASTDVVNGTSATFSVLASGDGVLTYQWQKDGVDIVTSGSISGATSATLVIDPARESDEGEYKCIVTSPFGSAESQIATLTVDSSGGPITDGDILSHILGRNITQEQDRIDILDENSSNQINIEDILFTDQP